MNIQKMIWLLMLVLSGCSGIQGDPHLWYKQNSNSVSVLTIVQGISMKTPQDEKKLIEAYARHKDILIFQPSFLGLSAFLKEWNGEYYPIDLSSGIQYTLSERFKGPPIFKKLLDSCEVVESGFFAEHSQLNYHHEIQCDKKLFESALEKLVALIPSTLISSKSENNKNKDKWVPKPPNITYQKFAAKLIKAYLLDSYDILEGDMPLSKETQIALQHQFENEKLYIKNEKSRIVIQLPLDKKDFEGIKTLERALLRATDLAEKSAETQKEMLKHQTIKNLITQIDLDWNSEKAEIGFDLIKGLNAYTAYEFNISKSELVVDKEYMDSIRRVREGGIKIATDITFSRLKEKFFGDHK
ncbi:hypothetical protein [Candidatus Parabeggiatoa sp. HSG14]|uniref:hypothetical protein n=1 Tax=Candidatus Parabeggiatoa sp. HSG14 TaxID=3055593 RepID=UPI0025A878B1|nr:hypothetical protein [Thiotrichales bacterium HSG14]